MKVLLQSHTDHQEQREYSKSRNRQGSEDSFEFPDDPDRLSDSRIWPFYWKHKQLLRQLIHDTTALPCHRALAWCVYVSNPSEWPPFLTQSERHRALTEVIARRTAVNAGEPELTEVEVRRAAWIQAGAFVILNDPQKRGMELWKAIQHEYHRDLGVLKDDHNRRLTRDKRDEHGKVMRYRNGRKMKEQGKRRTVSLEQLAEAFDGDVDEVSWHPIPWHETKRKRRSSSKRNSITRDERDSLQRRLNNIQHLATTDQWQAVEKALAGLGLSASRKRMQSLVLTPAERKRIQRLRRKVERYCDEEGIELADLGIFH